MDACEATSRRGNGRARCLQAAVNGVFTGGMIPKWKTKVPVPELQDWEQLATTKDRVAMTFTARKYPALMRAYLLEHPRGESPTSLLTAKPISRPGYLVGPLAGPTLRRPGNRRARSRSSMPRPLSTGFAGVAIVRGSAAARPTRRSCAEPGPLRRQPLASPSHGISTALRKFPLGRSVLTTISPRRHHRDRRWQLET